MCLGKCNVLQREFTRMGQGGIASPFEEIFLKNKKKERTVASWESHSASSTCLLEPGTSTVYRVLIPVSAVPMQSEHVWGRRGCAFENILFGCFPTSWDIVMAIHQVRSKRRIQEGRLSSCEQSPGFCKQGRTTLGGMGVRLGYLSTQLLPYVTVGAVSGSFCSYASKSR